MGESVGLCVCMHEIKGVQTKSIAHLPSSAMGRGMGQGCARHQHSPTQSASLAAGRAQGGLRPGRSILHVDGHTVNNSLLGDRFPFFLYISCRGIHMNTHALLLLHLIGLHEHPSAFEIP